MEADAVRIRGKGGPEILEVGTIEIHDPGASEVRIAVRAAGLNRADCLQRRGFYPAPPGVPEDVPGLEFAGEIDAVGEGVRQWSPGDRVMGIVGGGGMARQLITRADELLRIPADMSFEDAAAIPEVFLTAYDAIISQAGLQEGGSVLLHAVASGIGTAGIQLASVVGATSIGTSRTPDKLPRCTELGLDHAILVEDGMFADKVIAAAPKGVNVILDTVGAAYLSQNLKVIAKQGHIVVIGLMGGVKGELALGQLLAKRASITGSVLRSRSPQEKAALTDAFATDMLSHFGSGGLRPIVDDVLPMTDVQEAHRRMDANETFGKIVLRWD